jgi:hypothetical protein
MTLANPNQIQHGDNVEILWRVVHLFGGAIKEIEHILSIRFRASIPNANRER